METLEATPTHGERKPGVGGEVGIVLDHSGGDYHDIILMDYL